LCQHPVTGRKREKTEQIYELWDELADLPLAETRQSIELLFSKLSGWIGADNASWIGIIRVRDDESSGEDILHGWRLRAAERWLPPTEQSQEFIRKVLAHMERDPGMSTRKVVSQAGRFRSFNVTSRTGLVTLWMGEG